MDEPPVLERPDRIVGVLVRQLQASGLPQEQPYLSSRTRKHRWAAASFDSVAVEFQYKAVWVAKQLRERFGSPDRLAYFMLASCHLVGLRAAAWSVGGAIGYVSLREMEGARVSSFQVVLGAMRPKPPSLSGPEGNDAHDAVWIHSQLLH
jgi:hypothetical protein